MSNQNQLKNICIIKIEVNRNDKNGQDVQGTVEKIILFHLNKVKRFL